MKKIINILMLLMCVCLVSCDDESDTGIELKVIERDIETTPVGGILTATLSVEADAAVSDQSWCAASVSGKIVTITLEPNSALEGRTALITVTKDQQSISFAVTQPGNLFPDAGIGTIAFDAHGGTKKLEVYHGMSFTAVPEDSWLTAQVDGSNLILTAQKNYTMNTLRTKVKLTSAGLESELIVTQSGLTLIPEKQNITMYNGGDEATIKVKSTLPFKASSDADWLTIVSGDDYVTLTATDNSDQPLRTAKVTLVSETLTATINITQRPTIYSDYLGSWVLTGYDSGTPFTYNLSIVKSEEGSTYKVTGWGKSEIAVNSEYALEAVFDESTQYIYITQQTDLGIFTDESGDYDVMFRGLVDAGGGNLSYVNGSFICYIGMLQRDGTVQWINNILTIGNQQYELIGSFYCMRSHVDNEIYNFKDDEPFMYSPTMSRVSNFASPSSTRGVTNSRKVKTAAIGQLQFQN